jgi:hypothetical protein
MNRADVKIAIEETSESAGKYLCQAMMILYDKMTPQEVEKFAQSAFVGDTELNRWKFAKTLLLAVASEVLDREFNAESIKANVPKVRRIYRKPR